MHPFALKLAEFARQANGLRTASPRLGYPRAMLTYDPEVDAAYLTLGSPIQPGEVARTVEVETPSKAGTINADYDARGRLLGFEFLNASTLLRPEAIAAPEH